MSATREACMRAVMAALEHVVASPQRGDESVDMLVYHDIIDNFDFVGWSDEAIRNVLRAIVENAPNEDLSLIAEAARSSLAMFLRFEDEMKIEAATGKYANGAELDDNTTYEQRAADIIARAA